MREWLELMLTSLLALLQCEMPERDARSKRCFPSLVARMDDASALGSAASAAMGKSRVMELEAVLASTADAAAIRASVDAVATATAQWLSQHCGLRDATVRRAFVARRSFEEDQDVAGARFAAIVPLAKSQDLGIRFPDYVDSLPPHLERKCLAEDATPIVFSTERPPPPPPFIAEKFGTASPLVPYDLMCPPTCRGATCDAWLVNGKTLDDLTDCNCALCKETNATRFASRPDYDFQGGGTRFSSLRDVTFFPDVGQSLALGGRLKHSAAPVASGVNRELVLWFDDALCARADNDFSVFAFSLVVVVTVPVVLIIVFCIMDYDTPSQRKK